MKYVLDTNVFSAVMKGVPAVVARLAATPPVDVVVPQPVLAEVAYGIDRLPRSRRRAWPRARFEILARTIPRVEWTDAVGLACGAIEAALERRGSRLEDFDVAIAAHAVATDATLVTADRGHMPRIDGLRIEDWGR